MATHFHSLKVKKVQKETPDCVSVSFDIPEELVSTFTFREGQNITIKKMIDGEETRRSYSICNAPYENELKIAIKKVPGGLFSRFANDSLSAGDLLDILPPTGKFNAHLTGKKAVNDLAIAAGSGITPVIAIIKHTLQANPENNFTLVYGNQSRSSIIFFEELEALKNKYMQRFNLINILSREKTDASINYGRITTEKLTALAQLIDYKNMDNIYICGPEAMIFSASLFFEKVGINKKAIHFELFTVPGQVTTQNKSTAILTNNDKGPVSNISLKLDGRTFDFPLSYNGPSILETGLQQGADLPYACKGGVCCSCRAKLIEGRVEMDVNYALEPEEVEQGFILTCQSHPRTEKVIVDFDIK